MVLMLCQSGRTATLLAGSCLADFEVTQRRITGQETSIQPPPLVCLHKNNNLREILTTGDINGRIPPARMRVLHMRIRSHLLFRFLWSQPRHLPALHR